MHASSITTSPAARAFSAASSFSIPSCIQTALAPTRIALSTTGGTSSARRNTFTMSIFSGTSSSRAYDFSPSTSVSFGFTGIIRYPALCMYSVTPWLGRIGFEDSPTTAIVLLSSKTFVIASPSRCRLISAPSGMSTLIARLPVFPLLHLLPLFPLLPEISLSSRGEFTFARAFQNDLRHGQQALVVLFRSSNRYANRFRKAHPPQRPHDHAHLQQVIAQRLRIRPHSHKHKIRFARYRTESLLRQAFAQSLSLRGIRLDAPRHMLCVIQRRERRRLRHPRRIKRRPQFIHRRKEFGPANGIANAQSRQSINFRKRSQDQQIFSLAIRFHGIPQSHAHRVVDVRLIEHHQHAVRNRCEKFIKLFAPKRAARRIVRIRQVNHGRFRRDGLRHGLQIKRKLPLRRTHQLCAARANRHGKRRVRPFGRQPLQSRPQQHARRQVNQLARSQPDEKFIRRNSVPFRQRLPQRVRAAIRIPVRIGQHRLSGRNPFRRRPQRVLIRSELHRMNLQLAFHFFNRFSRNVNGQPVQIIRYEVFNRPRHLFQFTSTIVSPPMATPEPYLFSKLASSSHSLRRPSNASFSFPPLRSQRALCPLR